MLSSLTLYRYVALFDIAEQDAYNITKSLYYYMITRCFYNNLSSKKHIVFFWIKYNKILCAIKRIIYNETFVLFSMYMAYLIW